MAANPKARRLRTAVVASFTALALLTGCGKNGSETAAGPNAAVTDTSGGATHTDAAPPAAASTGSATGATTTAAANSGAKAKAEPAKAPGAKTGAAKPLSPTDPVTTTTADKAKAAAAVATTTDKAGTAGVASSDISAAVAKVVAGRAIFGGTVPCQPATLAEVRIGNVSTLSGVLGQLLAPVIPALQTFVTSQNACGGLNGHRIKFFYDDDQGDPATAVTKVQNMIQNNKVIAFLGNIQPLTIDAVTSTIRRSGIPIIGGDLVSNAWFTNPLIFPQSSPPQAVSYGFLKGATQYHKKNNVGDLWCLEVPEACQQIDLAFRELAPQLGATVKKSEQISITSPSYVQQCLDLRSAGVESVALIVDAATMTRVARSCEQVGYFPKVTPTPLGVGLESQFLVGDKWLGDAYIPTYYFPWFADETPAEKYWQASVKRYHPGFPTGGAASVGWTAGALLVAASAELDATNPSTADLLKVLYTFKGQKFTQLGDLTAPLTFREGSTPKIPYCLFGAIANATDTGWAKAVATPQCTDVIAPSDPQKNS